MKYKQYSSGSKRLLNNNNNDNNSDGNDNYESHSNGENGGHKNGGSRGNSRKQGGYDANGNHFNADSGNYKMNRQHGGRAASDGSEDDNDEFYEAQEHVTPRNLLGQDSMYSSSNRLTPSRRDSYRTDSSGGSSAGSVHAPNTNKSIFEFSSSLCEQKRLEDQQMDGKKLNIFLYTIKFQLQLF